MAHIVLITIGSGGDVYPFLRIGKLIIEEGHEVTLISHCVYKEKAEQLGFLFISSDTVEEYNSLMSAETHTEIQEPKGSISFSKTEMFPKIEKSFNKIISNIRHPTLIIGHNMLHGLVQMISEKMSTPYISVFLAPGYLEGEKMGASLNIFSEEYNIIRASVGLRPVVDWHSMIKNYSKGIAFWPDWFAQPEDGWPTNVIPAGFLLHENEEKIEDELQKWLIEKSPILITHATTPPSSRNYFMSAIEACEEMGLPAIIVSRHKEFLPSVLPKEIKHFDYLPFSKLISYVSVLVHHGGIGTTGQALLSGTPQLIMGKGFDRPRNAECVKKLGVGAFLPASKWNKEDVIDSLHALYQNEEMKQRCIVISNYFVDSDTDTVIKKVINEELTKPTMPNWSQMYKSTNKDLTMHQDKLSLLKSLSSEKRRMLISKLKDK